MVAAVATYAVTVWGALRLDHERTPRGGVAVALAATVAGLVLGSLFGVGRVGPVKWTLRLAPVALAPALFLAYGYADPAAPDGRVIGAAIVLTPVAVAAQLLPLAGYFGGGLFAVSLLLWAVPTAGAGLALATLGQQLVATGRPD